MTVSYPQTVTYWAPTTVNEFNEQGYDTPVAVSSRWEVKTNVMIPAGTANKSQVSKAVVYTKTPVTIKGFMFLGTSVAADPKTVDAAYPIKQTDKTVSIKGNRQVYRAWL